MQSYKVMFRFKFDFVLTIWLAVAEMAGLLKMGLKAYFHN